MLSRKIEELLLIEINMTFDLNYLRLNRCHLEDL